MVQIVGAHGGVAKGMAATSYLIDGRLLLDAGSVAGGLSVEEQAQIGRILISHAHLDHIKDLAFLCDNCFGLREEPFEVFCNHYVRKAIGQHLFNDVIWPDFSRLPSPDKPTIRFHPIASEQSLTWEDYRIIPVEVNHPGNALGFIVERDGQSLVFTQDTGPTERIWQLAKKCKNLQAIFTEASFPNQLASLARRSQHHTPGSLQQEIAKMPQGVPIFLGHLKPQFALQLQGEIAQIAPRERVQVIGASGTNYHFPGSGIGQKAEGR